MTITAINKKYQRTINAMYKYNRQYHALIDLDGMFDTDKEQRANERKTETARSKEMDYRAELPLRELTAYTKQYFKIHGYT